MTATFTKCGFPHDTEGTGGLTDFTSVTLSAQNSAIACVQMVVLVAANSSETITKVGYRHTTTTGTPATDSYRIGLQGVSDTTGDPDGTWVNGNAYVDFTPSSADNGKFIWKTLANSASLTRGQKVALVLTRIAATDASNCINVGYQSARVAARSGFPTPLTHNGTSWTPSSTGYPTMAYASATNYYGFPASSIINVNAFGSTTEVGESFTVPTSRCSTCVLLGFRWWGKTGGTGAKTIIGSLYSAPVSGSIAQIASTIQVDADLEAINGSSDRLHEFWFQDSTLPTLTAGTQYAVGIATTTASEMDLLALTVENAADLAAFYDNDMGIAFVTRTLTSYPPSGDDTNNFTETATKRPYIELVFGDLTPPAGGGGDGIAVLTRGGLAR